MRAMSITRWMAPAGLVQAAADADFTAAARSFRSPNSFVIGEPVTPPKIPPSMKPTLVAAYRSFQAFRHHLADRELDHVYRWVLYEPGVTADTPAAEQANPWQAMQYFGQLAATRGLRAIIAPERDLARAGTIRPAMPGEDITAWYLRVRMAEAAARHGSVVAVAARALAPSLNRYQGFVQAAASQAREANPFALRFAAVTSTAGDPGGVLASARAAGVSAYWLDDPAGPDGIGQVISLLRAATQEP